MSVATVDRSLSLASLTQRIKLFRGLLRNCFKFQKKPLNFENFFQKIELATKR